MRAFLDSGILTSVSILALLFSLIMLQRRLTELEKTVTLLTKAGALLVARDSERLLETLKELHANVDTSETRN